MAKIGYKTLLLLVNHLLSKGETDELQKIIDELLKDVRSENA